MNLSTDDSWIINNSNLINEEGLLRYVSNFRYMLRRPVVNAHTHDMLSVKLLYGKPYSDSLLELILLHLCNVYKDVPRELPILENINSFIHSSDLSIQNIILITKALKYHELKHQFIYTSMRCHLLYCTLNIMFRQSWKFYDETTHGAVLIYLLHDLPTGTQLDETRILLETRQIVFAHIFMRGSLDESFHAWSKILHNFLKSGLLSDSHKYKESGILDPSPGEHNSIVLASDKIGPKAIQKLCTVFPTRYGSSDLDFFKTKIQDHILQHPLHFCDSIKNLLAHNGLRQVLLHEISKPSLLKTNHDIRLIPDIMYDTNYVYVDDMVAFSTMVHLRFKPFFNTTNKYTVLMTRYEILPNNVISGNDIIEIISRILTQSLWFHLKQTTVWYNGLELTYEAKQLETNNFSIVVDHLNTSLLEYHKLIRLIIQTLYSDDITTVLPFIVDILANIFLSPIHPSSHEEDRKYLLALVTHECKLSTDKNAPINGIHLYLFGDLRGNQKT